MPLIVNTIFSYIKRGGSRGGSGGLLKPPVQPPAFKSHLKMKSFGLNETKFFHFHGIFKTNEIKSEKRTRPTFIAMNTISRNHGLAPNQKFNI